MVEKLSLFEMEEQGQEQMRINCSGALDIVKMEFSGAESLSWQELFSGYDSLHAITYSSGISFVYRLLDLFEEAEIISAATRSFPILSRRLWPTSTRPLNGCGKRPAE